MKTYIPEGYESILSVYDTQKAISLLKRLFEDRLGALLNLYRVSAPLFVEADSGLNDNLNGYERPVTFDILRSDATAQVVQSLAKWKRLALKRYCFFPGKGLYTDMDAIRRDEDELDNLHSIYVDQWDWEKVILPENRNLDYLKLTVMDIVKAAYLKEHKTAFIIGIGGALRSGKPHDGRAPDYDDWSLNGDIMFWCDWLNCAVELSSMGIRVDPETLDKQLTIAHCDDRRELPYHKMLLNGELPLTIGGGIGQSRLSLLLLGKAHIGEVQASIWDDDTVRLCAEKGVMLL